MKRLVINTLLVMACCSASVAQTRPQQSMYLFNYTQLNPAAIGIEDYGQLRTGFRRQWVGIDGAPSTAWLSGDMRLNTKKAGSATEAPSVISKGNGIGFNLYYDEIGPYASVNLNVGYAYHLPLSSSLALSAGFSGGLQQTRYDISKSMYPDQPVDPAALEQTNISKKYSPDLNAGIMLNGQRFFAGVSLMQIIRSEFVEADNSESTFKPQMMTALGYMFPLDEQGSGLWLSGVLKSDFANPVRYDINAKARYQDLLWVGATYRVEDAFGAGLGLNINRNLSVGYLYEWGIDKHISTYAKGSHELYLGFRFLKENQPGQPKMGW